MVQGSNPVDTDGIIFVLHYKASAFLLAAYGALAIQYQYLGSPMHCAETRIDRAYGQEQCWARDWYYTLGLSGADTTTRRAIYQWIPLLLFCQAFMFYLPRHFWKGSEGGKMAMLVEGLRLPLADDAKLERKKNDLIDYLRRNLHKQNLYFYKFFLYELMNWANVAAQIYVLSEFLPMYSLEALRDADPVAGFFRNLDAVFPKLTKCTISVSGASGSIQRYDTTCVLPANLYHAKAFSVLGIWLLVMFLLSAANVVFRLATLLRPLRRVLLRWRAGGVEATYVDVVTRKASVGDWFVVYQMAKNIDPVAFKSLLTDFAKEL